MLKQSSVSRSCSTLNLLSLSKTLLRYFPVNHWPRKSPHFNSSSGLCISMFRAFSPRWITVLSDTFSSFQSQNVPSVHLIMQCGLLLQNLHFKMNMTWQHFLKYSRDKQTFFAIIWRTSLVIFCGLQYPRINCMKVYEQENAMNIKWTLCRGGT